MSAKAAPGSTITPPAVADVQETLSIVPEPSEGVVEKPRYFDTAKALELRFKGHSLTDIGILLCPEQPYQKTTVAYHLDRFKKFTDNPEALKGYEAQRGQVLHATEFELLRSMLDEEAIQKASLRDRAIAFGTVFDKRRLESGQSTNNLGVLGKLVVEAASEVFTVKPGKKALITKDNAEPVD